MRRRRRGDQARPQASGRERRSGGERAGGRARVYVYVAVVCKVCTWGSGEGERGHNDLWGGGERGDRTGRGIAEQALERAPPPSNPSTSGFTGKPALVLDRPGGIPQGYGLTSRRSVTEPRWVSSPPSYCATAPLPMFPTFQIGDHQFFVVGDHQSSTPQAHLFFFPSRG